MSSSFQSILMYGMGMMGSSLVCSLKLAWPDIKITGVVRSQSSAEFIKKHEIANEVIIQEQVEAIAKMDLNSYDLVILGIPPHSVINLIPHIPATDTLITDMSSTRKSVHDTFATRPELRFIGSHPMCGSENNGPQAGLSDLFRNKLCLILEDDRFKKVTDTDRIKLNQLWHDVGMQCFTMTPEKHDEVLAYLSHGPHILSSLLTLWAQEQPVVNESTARSPMPITGGGFKSMARIAGSNPEMWSDIMDTNSDNILDSLKQFHSMLGDLIQQIPNRNSKQWHEWFNKSRKERDHLCDYEK